MMSESDGGSMFMRRREDFDSDQDPAEDAAEQQRDEHEQPGESDRANQHVGDASSIRSAAG